MEKLWLVLSMTWQPTEAQRAARRGLGGGEPKRRERKEMKKELPGFPPQPLPMTQTLDIIIWK